MDIHLDSNHLINIGVSILTTCVICTYGCYMYKHCKINEENSLSENDTVNNIELTDVSIHNSPNNKKSVEINIDKNTNNINQSFNDLLVEDNEEKNFFENNLIKADDVPEWAKREFLRDKICKKKVFT